VPKKYFTPYRKARIAAVLYIFNSTGQAKTALT